MLNSGSRAARIHCNAPPFKYSQKKPSGYIWQQSAARRSGLHRTEIALTKAIHVDRRGVADRNILGSAARPSPRSPGGSLLEIKERKRDNRLDKRLQSPFREAGRAFSADKSRTPLDARGHHEYKKSVFALASYSLASLMNRLPAMLSRLGKRSCLSKHVWFDVVPLVSAFLPLAVRATDDVSALVRQAKPAVVELLTLNARNQLLAIGSGFFMTRNGWVITNQHVLSGAHSVFARASNGAVYPLNRVLARDARLDIMTLWFRTPNVPYLTLDRSDVVEGQRVLVIGNPEAEGLEGTVSEGIVSAIREGGKFIQITAPISPGSSGSPVLNEQGKVIGVASSILRGGQNLNFAISAKAILGLTRTAEQIARDRMELSKALLSRLTKELGLTTAQQSKAKPIILRFATDSQTLMDNYDSESATVAEATDFAAKANQVTQQYDADMIVILTPAQKEKFVAIYDVAPSSTPKAGK